MENTDLDAFGYVYEHLIWNYASLNELLVLANMERLEN